MSALHLRWKTFWSRRSRPRTNTALFFALVALLGCAYLALPAGGQGQALNALLTVMRGAASVGPGPVVAVSAVLCAVVSMVLIFVPSYRRHSYLATARSIIPPVSVYLDAENQLSVAAIRSFTQFLMKHLDGRRSDLLYFLDASQTANGDKYKILYRFGFRPVDVPHSPTGEGTVKEAVDREIDMHAYERALLGPEKQEFIIVTGDGDFVPLVYRLVAQGHRVQIWASPIRETYRALEKYVGVTVLDLTRILLELPDVSDGEDAIYRAMRSTLTSLEKVVHQHTTAERKRTNFYGGLGGELRPQLAGVGYSYGQYREYWVEHMSALGLIQTHDGKSLPQPGGAEPADAARHLYAMVNAAAGSLQRLATTREDGIISMEDVATDLASQPFDADSDDTAPLRALLLGQPEKRRLHARYFVRCARALGLVAFQDVSYANDTIRYAPVQPSNGVTTEPPVK